MNTDMWKYTLEINGLATGSQVSLGEGNTPLVKSRYIGPSLGLSNLYFKLENLNPSGSYKDRFASPLISSMYANQQKFCIATSSGNTGAALSAYAAAAGIKCILIIVEGAPLAKIRQMQLYGANPIMVKGFGLDSTITSRVFDQLKQLTSSYQLPLPISAFSICPVGMQGVQTILYEIAEQLNPAHVFVPAGGGGLALAMTKGVERWMLHHGGDKIAIHCVQPAGNDTMASSIRNRSSKASPVAASTTSISGLQVPSILDGNEVVTSCIKLGGNGYVVQDEEVYSLQKQLAMKEGIFSEPAGSVALAGLTDAIRRKEINPDDRIVCLITGSGFKDMAAVDRHFSLPKIELIEQDHLTTNVLKLV